MGEFKLRLDSCALKSPKTTNRKIVYCNPDFCTAISKFLHILTKSYPLTKDNSYQMEAFFYLTLGYILQVTFETTTTCQERLNGLATSTGMIQL